MSLQLAFAWSPECEEELKKMGFKKQEVYVKDGPIGPSDETRKQGDREFFSMRNPPLQFATTTFWGASYEL